MNFIQVILSKLLPQNINLKKSSIILIALITVGAFMSFYGVPKLVQTIVKYLCILKPGHFMRQKHENKLPFTYKLYLWNVTNPDEISAGTEKPKLDEIGPYVFSQFKQKVETNDSDTEDIYNFDLWNIYHFSTELSAPLTGDEIVILPNVVLVRPILAVSDGAFKKFLIQNVPTIGSKFWPTIWCVESRAQTVFASILRSKIFPTIHYRREILTLKDGGEVALDWMEDDCEKLSPLILILPGLTGASQAEYIKCLVMAARSIGIRTVVFNNRGLGGIELKTPRLYCAANIEDLSEVVNHIKKLNPDVRLGATGISMGGLILGNYMAINGLEASKIFTACQIISVPWNVHKGCDSIEKPYLNSLLGQHLASNLCKTLNKCDILKNGEFDMDKILQSKTIKEFDANFTSKHFGFEDVEHYYRSATLHDKLHKITTPILCLSAADDPFQPLDAIPIDAASNSSHVAIIITARGGHIGFLEGIWPNLKDQYMGRLFGEYFAATLFDDRNFSKTSQQMINEFKLTNISTNSETMTGNM